jgi:hypothetical protein
LLGKFIVCPGEKSTPTKYVFAMQMHEENEFTIPSAANGQQCELNLKHRLSFNLD